MFANFFGIVIISASALLIAGLVLRTTPDLPATMNLGLVDKIVDSTSQAASTNKSEATSTASDAENTSGTDASATATAGDSTSTDSSSSSSTTENTTASESTSTQTDSDNSAKQTTTESAAGDTDTKGSTPKQSSESSSSEPAPTGLSKEYLEIRRRAIEQAGSAHTRTNKSDGANRRNQ